MNSESLQSIRSVTTPQSIYNPSKANIAQYTKSSLGFNCADPQYVQSVIIRQKRYLLCLSESQLLIITPKPISAGVLSKTELEKRKSIFSKIKSLGNHPLGKIVNTIPAQMSGQITAFRVHPNGKWLAVAEIPNSREEMISIEESDQIQRKLSGFGSSLRVDSQFFSKTDLMTSSVNISTTLKSDSKGNNIHPPPSSSSSTTQIPSEEGLMLLNMKPRPIVILYKMCGRKSTKKIKFIPKYPIYSSTNFSWKISDIISQGANQVWISLRWMIPSGDCISLPEKSTSKTLINSIEQKQLPNVPQEFLILCSGEPDFNVVLYDFSKRKSFLRGSRTEQLCTGVLPCPFDNTRFLSFGIRHVESWQIVKTFTGQKLKSSLGNWKSSPLSNILSGIVVIFDNSSKNLIYYSTIYQSFTTPNNPNFANYSCYYLFVTNSGLFQVWQLEKSSVVQPVFHSLLIISSSLDVPIDTPYAPLPLSQISIDDSTPSTPKILVSSFNGTLYYINPCDIFTAISHTSPISSHLELFQDPQDDIPQWIQLIPQNLPKSIDVSPIYPEFEYKFPKSKRTPIDTSKSISESQSPSPSSQKYLFSDILNILPINSKSLYATSLSGTLFQAPTFRGAELCKFSVPTAPPLYYSPPAPIIAITAHPHNDSFIATVDKRKTLCVWKFHDQEKLWYPICIKNLDHYPTIIRWPSADEISMHYDDHYLESLVSATGDTHIWTPIFTANLIFVGYSNGFFEVFHIDEKTLLLALNSDWEHPTTRPYIPPPVIVSLSNPRYRISITEKDIITCIYSTRVSNSPISSLTCVKSPLSQMRPNSSQQDYTQSKISSKRLSASNSELQLIGDELSPESIINNDMNSIMDQHSHLADIPIFGSIVCTKNGEAYYFNFFHNHIPPAIPTPEQDLATLNMKKQESQNFEEDLSSSKTLSWQFNPWAVKLVGYLSIVQLFNKMNSLLKNTTHSSINVDTSIVHIHVDPPRGLGDPLPWRFLRSAVFFFANASAVRLPLPYFVPKIHKDGITDKPLLRNYLTSLSSTCSPLDSYQLVAIPIEEEQRISLNIYENLKYLIPKITALDSYSEYLSQPTTEYIADTFRTINFNSSNSIPSGSISVPLNNNFFDLLFCFQKVQSRFSHHTFILPRTSLMYGGIILTNTKIHPTSEFYLPLYSHLPIFDSLPLEIFQEPRLSISPFPPSLSRYYHYPKFVNIDTPTIEQMFLNKDKQLFFDKFSLLRKDATRVIADIRKDYLALKAEQNLASSSIQESIIHPDSDSEWFIDREIKVIQESDYKKRLSDIQKTLSPITKATQSLAGLIFLKFGSQLGKQATPLTGPPANYYHGVYAKNGSGNETNLGIDQSKTSDLPIPPWPIVTPFNISQNRIPSIISTTLMQMVDFLKKSQDSNENNNSDDGNDFDDTNSPDTNEPGLNSAENTENTTSGLTSELSNSPTIVLKAIDTPIVVLEETDFIQDYDMKKVEHIQLHTSIYPNAPKIIKKLKNLLNILSNSVYEVPDSVSVTSLESLANGHALIFELLEKEESILKSSSQPSSSSTTSELVGVDTLSHPELDLSSISDQSPISPISTDTVLSSTTSIKLPCSSITLETNPNHNLTHIFTTVMTLLQEIVDLCKPNNKSSSRENEESPETQIFRRLLQTESPSSLSQNKNIDSTTNSDSDDFELDSSHIQALYSTISSGKFRAVLSSLETLSPSIELTTNQSQLSQDANNNSVQVPQTLPLKQKQKQKQKQKYKPKKTITQISEASRSSLDDGFLLKTIETIKSRISARKKRQNEHSKSISQFEKALYENAKYDNFRVKLAQSIITHVPGKIGLDDPIFHSTQDQDSESSHKPNISLDTNSESSQNFNPFTVISDILQGCFSIFSLHGKFNNRLFNQSIVNNSISTIREYYSDLRSKYESGSEYSQIDRASMLSSIDSTILLLDSHQSASLEQIALLKLSIQSITVQLSLDIHYHLSILPIVMHFDKLAQNITIQEHSITQKLSDLSDKIEHFKTLLLDQNNSISKNKSLVSAIHSEFASFIKGTFVPQSSVLTVFSDAKSTVELPVLSVDDEFKPTISSWFHSLEKKLSMKAGNSSDVSNNFDAELEEAENEKLARFGGFISALQTGFALTNQQDSKASAVNDPLANIPKQLRDTISIFGQGLIDIWKSISHGQSQKTDIQNTIDELSTKRSILASSQSQLESKLEKIVLRKLGTLNSMDHSLLVHSDSISKKLEFEPGEPKPLKSEESTESHHLISPQSTRIMLPNSILQLEKQYHDILGNGNTPFAIESSTPAAVSESAPRENVNNRLPIAIHSQEFCAFPQYASKYFSNNSSLFDSSIERLALKIKQIKQEKKRLSNELKLERKLLQSATEEYKSLQLLKFDKTINLSQLESASLLEMEHRHRLASKKKKSNNRFKSNPRLSSTKKVLAPSNSNSNQQTEEEQRYSKLSSLVKERIQVEKKYFDAQNRLNKTRTKSLQEQRRDSLLTRIRFQNEEIFRLRQLLSSTLESKDSPT